jgi:hypothetical protein
MGDWAQGDGNIWAVRQRPPFWEAMIIGATSQTRQRRRIALEAWRLEVL